VVEVLVLASFVVVSATGLVVGAAVVVEVLVLASCDVVVVEELEVGTVVVVVTGGN